MNSCCALIVTLCHFGFRADITAAPLFRIYVPKDVAIANIVTGLELFVKSHKKNQEVMAYSYKAKDQNDLNTSGAQEVLKTELRYQARTEFCRAVRELSPECGEERLAKAADGFAESFFSKVVNKIVKPSVYERLQTLYENEKHYLDILKEYKEEIKFAASLQAEIRKEEANFFSSTLKEVCQSMKETQIDPKYQSQWIYDLVTSYTSSLMLSGRLAEEHVIDLLGDIQTEISETIKKEG